MSGQPRRGTIVRRSAPVIGARRPQVVRRRIGSGVQAPPPPPLPWWRRYGHAIAFGAVALLFVGVLGAVGFWAYSSPAFRVSEIEVAGAERVAQQAVIDQAGLLDEHMALLDVDAAEQAISELPLVRSATVKRDWPTTVRVTIEERQPWGIWLQSGVDYAIDREGVVLGTTLLPGDGAPRIRSTESGTRIVGDRVDVEAVNATAALYDLLPARLGVVVTEVAFVAGKGVQVTTASGQVAIFGDSSGIEYKLAVWEAIAAEAASRNLAYTTIDLRFGNRPVVQ